MDLVPGPGAWPLSAAATSLLRAPQTPPPALLRMALRELVVRGVVRVHVEPRQGRRPAVVRLAPGHAAATGLPASLRALAEALAPHLSPDGTPAHTAVRRATGWHTDLGGLVRQAARDELRTAGLLAEERGRLLGVVPRTRWQPTPSGRAWARSAADAAVGAAALTTAALPAPGLLLALDQDLQRRLRDASGDASGGADVGSAGWVSDDLDHLDAVLGEAGPALDSAADGGSGGGDGGDGGGGD